MYAALSQDKIDHPDDLVKVLVNFNNYFLLLTKDMFKLDAKRFEMIRTHGQKNRDLIVGILEKKSCPRALVRMSLCFNIIEQASWTLVFLES